MEFGFSNFSVLDRADADPRTRMRCRSWSSGALQVSHSGNTFTCGDCTLPVQAHDCMVN